MLPKNSRLKKSRDIDELFKKGESAKGSLFICKYKGNSEPTDRTAFSMAKNLKLKAFQKNRYKRQIAHAFKEVYDQLESNMSEQKFDMFFILMKEPSDKETRYDQFTKDLAQLISQVKCQRKS